MIHSLESWPLASSVAKASRRGVTAEKSMAARIDFMAFGFAVKIWAAIGEGNGNRHWCCNGECIQVFLSIRSAPIKRNLN